MCARGCVRVCVYTPIVHVGMRVGMHECACIAPFVHMDARDCACITPFVHVDARDCASSQKYFFQKDNLTNDKECCT